MPAGVRNALLLALACATQPSSQRGADRSSPSDAGPAVSLEGSGLTGPQVRVEGCAAHPELADQPPTRALPPPAHLEVQPTAGGVRVVHQVPHACCLRASVTSEVTGTIASVRENLSGTPCRCMCASTLTTVLSLPPGTYQVDVELTVSGRTEAEPPQTVTVR
jgi:hypothetical protein